MKIRNSAGIISAIVAIALASSAPIAKAALPGDGGLQTVQYDRYPGPPPDRYDGYPKERCTEFCARASASDAGSARRLADAAGS